MAIIVDNDTRLVVQGLTGSEGRFHGLRNRAYGTHLVAGVTPGKGGQDVEGVPVFNTVAEAVSEQGANTAMIFVPAPFAADAVYEAVDAGIGIVICITEGVPAHDMLRIIDEDKSEPDGYLYPASMFAPIELPEAAERALMAAGG